ncbi:hypothetical protein BSZ31_05335 [Limnobacter sp. SAORIC-690]|jgi:uncharacterized membrane protein YkoI|uniref:PepSY domain-containing protein n=1 Tax=unclassified Limnobacter TaxID=2630203 RepID=UPI000CF57E2D|nr:PepSY domain-containing protein [Limnobacter sp. SAORIC-690]PQJ24475.1 hypothetical protein BSZ31_05335 [Limnobacter sp. SAORIC-690]
MMKVRALTFLVALLCFASVLPPFAYADDDKRIRQLQLSGEILSLEQIFDRARKVKPGRVVDVDLDKDDGRYIYEIELLESSGKVWEMEFDARTGELLQLEQDD